jgi:sugar lactone lactonase YvrE
MIADRRSLRSTQTLIAFIPTKRIGTMKKSLLSWKPSALATLAALLLSTVARAAPGDLYEGDVGTGSVVRFPAGGTKVTYASGLGNVVGMVFDGDGNFFVSDGSTAIYKISPSGIRTTFATGLQLPQGIAFDGLGNLFVSERAAGRILKITPGGSKTTFASNVGGPQGIAVDRAGNIYVAENETRSVAKLTPSGAKTTVASALGRPQGLALDAAGNVFVSDQQTGEIVKITPAGVKSSFASGLDSPVGLAFDSSGNLFVSNQGTNEILLVTPSGARSTFASGLNVPEYLVFEPVAHQLLNISTRGFVSTGDDVLIGGFIVGGDGPVNKRVLIRAIGPSLAAAGVSNPLSDPTVELHNSAGETLTNDDWKATQQAEIQATGLAPTNELESALLVLLPAGNYTAVVRGLNSTGNALVEVYNLQ